MGQKIITKSIGVHDGTFHADEVMASALLCLFDLADRKKIIRTRDPKLLDTCEFVCDVGEVYNPEKKRFDHHQISYKGPLSSAGMILQYLKEQKIVPEKLYSYLNRQLVQGIDEHDTGVTTTKMGTMNVSVLIALFNPIDPASSDEKADKCFFKALEFSLDVLRSLIKRFQYNESCIEIVQQAMQKNDSYLLFDHSLSWQDAFFELGGGDHPALFVIMPSKGSWKLRAIPPSIEKRMDMRCPLPESWAGLSFTALQEKSGIPGAIFCHKGRFFSVWQTKEDALQALEIAIKEFRS